MSYLHLASTKVLTGIPFPDIAGDPSIGEFYDAEPAEFIE
jgi:hypothetical protein